MLPGINTFSQGRFGWNASFGNSAIQTLTTGADVTDLALNDRCAWLQITPTVNVNVNSFVAPTIPNQIIRLTNNAARGSGLILNIRNENSGITAVNRIYTPEGATWPLLPGYSADIVYDLTSTGQRWRMLAENPLSYQTKQFLGLNKTTWLTVRTLLAAGHLPGFYLLHRIMNVSTAATSGSTNDLLSFSTPGIGAVTGTGFATTVNMTPVRSAGLSTVSTTGILSDGSADVTANGGVQSIVGDFVADVYYRFQYLGA